MEQYRLRDAAKMLGISYQTLKLWIYQKQIRSTKTPGGITAFRAAKSNAFQVRESWQR